MSRLGPKDRLTEQRLSSELGSLPDWELTGDGQRIARTLLFTSFAQAFAFMTEVALIAESRDHHPEWCNVWNRVEIKLTTHSAGGITVADVSLAKAIDEVAARYDLMCNVKDNGSCGGCR